MVKLINAFRGTDPTASALAEMGKRMFGDQLTPAIKREQLRALQRQNTETELLGRETAAFNTPDYDPRRVAARAALTGDTGYADRQRFMAATTSDQFDPISRAMLGAGGAMSGTPSGFSSSLAEQARQADAGFAEQKRQFDQKPMPALGADGTPTFAPQGQAAGGGFQPILSNTERQGTLVGQNFGQMGSLPVPEQTYLGATAGSPQTVVNVGENGVQFPDPQPGYDYIRGPDGRVKIGPDGMGTQAPIPGSKAWSEQQQVDAKGDMTRSNREVSGNIVIQDIDRALGRITDSPLMNTGVGAYLTKNIAGFPAFDTAALVDTIRVNTGFDKLQQMRDSSPTGGALGPVSDAENAMLQQALGNLEIAQGEQQVTDNLKRVKNVYNDIIHGEGLGPPREVLSFEQAPPALAPAAAASPTGTGGPPIGTIEDGYQFMGGDPGDPASWQKVQ